MIKQILNKIQVKKKTGKQWQVQVPRLIVVLINTICFVFLLYAISK